MASAIGIPGIAVNTTGGEEQGRGQDVSLRGVSVRAERAGYAGTFLGERSESVTPAAGEKFLGLTARKTSKFNLAIEISFVPSSQNTFNFSVLRGTQIDFLLFNLLRPGPGAMHLAGEPDFFENYSF